jgi:hypothetical protein
VAGLLFEVDAWGDQLGDTASAPRWCTMSGVAKVGSPIQRYVVPNEFICGRMALMLGLPVPPGVVVRTDERELAYVSLRFGKRGENLPPVIAAHVVQDNPVIAAGIVALDCWLINTDRHRANLAYSREGSPLTIFDHGHALLGDDPTSGSKRLDEYREIPVISYCLGPFLTTAAHFRRWTERIAAIRDDLIEDVVSEVTCGGGLTPDEGSAVRTFLIDRKTRVSALLAQARDQLPKATDWETAR